ncbi:MAG: hypothetical protein GY950_07915, partial [bacterium]|nr:hypothetical protein [bacterium]
MAIIDLYKDSSAGYEINTDLHSVKKPERAEKRFEKQLYLKGSMWVIAGLICLVLWIFFIVPEVKPILYGTKSDFKRLDYLFLFLGFAIPVFSLGTLVTFFKAFNKAESEPLRGTAQETVNTFVEALQFGFWEVAYNCLTDTAQQTEVKVFSTDPSLRRKFSKIPFIKSLKDFRKHWDTFSVDITWN